MRPGHERPLATIDRITAELQALMQREHDKVLRTSYEAAISHLHTALFRLNQAERPAPIPDAPKPAPEPAKPEAVRKSVVVAKPPKRRG